MKVINTLPKILLIFSEYLLYLLIIFLFIDQGQTFREVAIYTPLILLFLRALISQENPVDIKNRIFILVIFLCFSGIIASIFSPEPYYSLKWFKKTYLKLFFVTLAFIYIFQTPQKLENLSNLFVFLTLLFSILTIYEFYTKVFLKSYDFGTTIRKYIVPLEIFCLFIPCFIVTKKTKFLKIIGLSLLLITLLAIIFTGSRGGWISVLSGIAVWLIGYTYITKANIKKIVVVTVSMTVIIFIVISICSPSYVKVKIEQLLKGYTSQRKEYVWPIAIESYKNLPLINKIFGNGLGRMTYLEDFKKYYINRFGKEPEELYSPHNVYLGTLYKQGIFGLTIFFALFFTSFKILFKSLKMEQSLKMKTFALSLIAVLSVFMIHGLVEDMRFNQLLLIIPLIGAYNGYLWKMKND